MLSPARVVALVLLLYAASLASNSANKLAAQSGCTEVYPPCPPDEPPAVSIEPGGGSFTTPGVIVTIYFYDDYQLDAATYGIALGGGATGSFALVGEATTTSRVYSGTVNLQPGSGNTVTARICDVASPAQCTEHVATLTYSTPPPPPPLSLAPHNGDNRDVGRCMAACFDHVVGYSTPAYMSRDVSRSVTLIYSAARVLQKSTVIVDGSDFSGNPPVKMSLRIKRADGTFVSLDGGPGGATEHYFAAGAGTSRLGARFTDASPTGAYTYTAVVARLDASDNRIEDTASARVLVFRNSQSPYGLGWGIAGIERIDSTYGGVVITNGNGSISFFLRCTTGGCLTYTSPTSDFSALSRRADGSGYDRRWPDSTKASYDANGRLSWVKDRWANQTTYAYSGTSDRLTSITDPAGRVTTFGYDASTKLDWIQDPGGRVTQILVNGAGDLVEIRDPDNVVAFSGSYDAAHVLTSQTDRRGGQWTYHLDHAGKVDSIYFPQVTADGQTVRPVQTLRSHESVVLLNNPALGTSANPAPRRIADSVRARVTEPKGDSTRFAVNRFGTPTRVESWTPQGKLEVVTTNYDDQGRVTRVVNAKGASTTYGWTGIHLTSVKDNVTGLDVTYGYETVYQQLERTWVNGALRTQHFYSGLLRGLDSTRVGDSSVTQYTWNTQGRLTQQRDPNNHIMSIAYQPGGQQNTLSVTAPTGTGGNGTTTLAYDSHGRVASTTDPLGRVVTTAYDSINRVTQATGPLATTTRFGYNDALRRDSVIDAIGQAYRGVSNALGWPDSVIDPGNRVERHFYDRNGNVTRYTNRRGQDVTFTYDGRNRPLTIGAGGKTTRFVYDSLSRWAADSNAESIDTVRFDTEGRLVRAVTMRAGQGYALEYTYTDQGQRNALRAYGPWGSRDIGYGYDAIGRLNWLRQFGGGATAFKYTNEHLVSQVDLPTGSSTETRMQQNLTYNTAHLTTEIAFSPTAPTWGLRRWYTHDALDRVTQIGRYGPGDTRYRDAAYDSLGRLTSYTDTRHWQTGGGLVCPDPFDLNSCYQEPPENHSEVVRQASYSYDKVGNRTDLGAAIQPGNRLTSFDGYMLTYDDDGNLLTKTKTGFSQTLYWNALGQLDSVSTNGTMTRFGYDARGRRVRKTTGAMTTRYVWDGDDIVLELSGTTLVREYTYYPGIDKPHSVRRTSDGKRFYYATEIPGHVAGLVDSARNVVNWYEYTPWGEAIAVTEGVAQPLRYTGREWDAETQLYYVRMRYYDPKLGRFISEDPIGLEGGLNVYAYVENDPLNDRDPLGLETDDEGPCPGGYEWVRSWDIELSDGMSATANRCVNASGEVLVTYTNIALGLPPIVVGGCQFCGPYSFNPGHRPRGSFPLTDPLLVAMAKGGRQYFPMDDDLVRGLSKASTPKELRAGLQRVQDALRQGNLPKPRATALRGWQKVVRRDWLPNALRKAGGGAGLGILLWLAFPEPLGGQCPPGIHCN